MKRTYKTSDLANAFHIHTNTVRLYEKLRFIQEPERTKSNYRIYTDVQFMQISICRCIFGHPFTTRRIRHSGNELIHAAYEWDIPLCEQRYTTYFCIINEEIELANQTAQILKNWIDKTPQRSDHKTYTRKEAAAILHTTSETIRNWERNNLIHPCQTGPKNEILFYSCELERMHIIYMLLQAGYSLFAIQQSLSKYDRGEREKVIDTLKESCSKEDLMLVGDRWLCSLEEIRTASLPLPSLIAKMKDIDIS